MSLVFPTLVELKIIQLERHDGPIFIDVADMQAYARQSVALMPELKFLDVRISTHEDAELMAEVMEIMKTNKRKVERAGGGPAKRPAKKSTKRPARGQRK